MELLKRVIPAIIFIPLILGIFYLGGIALLSFLGLVVLLQVFELREMFLKKNVTISLITIPFSVIIFLVFSQFSANEMFLSVVVFFIFISGIDLFSQKLEGASERISHNIFVVFYSPILLSFVYRLRTLSNGKYLILSLLVLIWIVDTFAYFVGMSIGKHRGIFKASPNKSLEGFLAGIVFGILGAFVAGKIFGFSGLEIFALAISAGIFGQFGDLVESLIKRDVGVKDSSNLLPGHGGIVDRFDSITLAAPIFYLIINLF
ncbi:MAG: hypothetical protein B6D62_05080 [Candidatus Cloacimonas sp. 4484_275]|nr:MAG: hypothetical protein B6D62_05080 [Candidatus Cloacimonas sp. 4484_275]